MSQNRIDKRWFDLPPQQKMNHLFFPVSFSLETKKDLRIQQHTTFNKDEV